MRDIVVVTGYCPPSTNTVSLSEDFFDIWVRNTLTINPRRIYVVNGGGTPIKDTRCEWINADNLGRNTTMPRGQQLSGWSASFVMGCLLAYHNNADLVFKEQDCLAFGRWLERFRDEIGNAGAISGHANTSGAATGLNAQSLVLVKYDFLLPFACAYLSIQEPCSVVMSEQKFDRVAALTGRLARTTMGHDRSRPIDYDTLPFYAQQLTAEEMAELRVRKLI